MKSDVLPRRACRVAILWQLKTSRHIGGIAGLGQVGELLMKRLASARAEKGIAISGICNRGRRHFSQRVAFGIDVREAITECSGQGDVVMASRRGTAVPAQERHYFQVPPVLRDADCCR